MREFFGNREAHQKSGHLSSGNRTHYPNRLGGRKKNERSTIDILDEVKSLRIIVSGIKDPSNSHQMQLDYLISVLKKRGVKNI